MSNDYYSLNATRLLENKADATPWELMQRAGKSLFDQCDRRFERILIVLGCGNNAGDALVFYQLALKAGHRVDVFQIYPDKQGSDLFQKAWNQAQVTTLVSRDNLDFNDYDLVVDAVFGVGLNREMDEYVSRIIRQLNESDVFVLSVDIPSGLDTDTGSAMPIAVQATETLTFIVRKKGLILADGLRCAGSIHLADLGVSLSNQLEPAIRSVAGHVSNIRPFQRANDAYKNSVGKVLVIGGNKGMAGASLLASHAALRVGSGYVKILCHPENIAALSAQTVDCVVLNGSLAALEKQLDWADVVVIGPGLGQDEWSHDMMRITAQSSCTSLIDADALYLTKKHTFSAPVVLTPHIGEAAMLTNKSVSWVQSNRLEAVRMMLQYYQSGSVVLLKGAGTLVGQDDNVFVSEVGHPAMAVAGMGDVLSGVIGGFLSQGYSLLDSACLGVDIHGRCGQSLATHLSLGLTSTDAVKELAIELRRWYERCGMHK